MTLRRFIRWLWLDTHGTLDGGPGSGPRPHGGSHEEGEHKAHDKVKAAFEKASGLKVKSVEWNEDEEIIVETDKGRFKMTIGSDDDDMRFKGPDGKTVKFPMPDFEGE